MSAKPQIKRPELGGEVLESEVKLCAGPLRMIFDHGDLRYITFRDREIVRRIYAAVRDRNWGTIPGTRSNLKIDSGRDFFQISYDSEHTQDDISFVWHAEISGDADGTIKFSFDGEARSTFLKNRIGLCVLHPTNLAGQKCLLMRADGTKLEAHFPRLVAQEQPIRDLFDLKAMGYKIAPDAHLGIEFEGDLFETEDQRNWIDDSYKTYSTPQHLPYPVEISRGTRIRQSVELIVGGDLRYEPIAVFEEPPPIELKSDFENLRPLPAIGLGVSKLLEKYSEKTIARLRALKLDHLRVDNHPFLSNRAQIAHAQWESEVLGLPLEVALSFEGKSSKHSTVYSLWIELCGLNARNWTVLTQNSKSTLPETLALAKKIIPGGSRIGVGTAADFYQLNQQRPPWEDADFVSWSMNPQVHAFDDLSLAETPAGIAAQIESARAYFPGKALHIAPITLKPRCNPVATFAERERTKNDLPPDVDPRQCSLVGAAWTLATLSALAQSGADSVTFYETVGWRGVIERDAGSPLPEKFSSTPGGVFPVYYVFRWIADFPKAHVAPIELSRTNEIAALCLVSGDTYRLLVANLTPHEQQVKVHGGKGKKREMRMSSLHKQLLPFAMQEPEKFLEMKHGAADPYLLNLSLLPQELVCIDWKKRGG
jgi:hypothetical protein